MISLLDHFLQLLAGKEDAALDGAKGKIKRFSNLLVLMTEIVHFERNAKRLIEVFHHGAQLIHHDIGFSAVADRSCSAIDVIEVLGRIYDGAGLDVLAIVVDEDILHDRQQPCLEISPRDELVYVADRAESGFLI